MLSIRPKWVEFQSTRPMRGATLRHCHKKAHSLISIHAPHAGRDLLDNPYLFHIQADFNPRAPCGARPAAVATPISTKIFQSTRPMRGATAPYAGVLRSLRISIHAPHAGRDVAILEGCGSSEISIHAPHAGRDCRTGAAWGSTQISIHAPHAGRDSKHAQKITYIFAITDKRNAFSRQTPSVRAFDRELRGEFHYKTRCEPSWKSLRASSSHYTIKVSSGRYVCLQPKCSILLSYFFPR